MKTSKLFSFLSAIVVTLLLVSCSEDDAAIPNQSPLTSDSQELSSEQKSFLLSIIEIQKLHRDVYNIMTDRVQDQFFVTLSEGDSQFMERLSIEVDKYGLVNPVTDKNGGEYINAQIQTIYDNFIHSENFSLEQNFQFALEMEENLIEDIKLHQETVYGNPGMVQTYIDLMKESLSQKRSLDIELRSIEDIEN